MSKEYMDLSIAPADTAFALMAEYDADTHPSKVSLLAGAYRDEEGQPWVLPSVREAKARLSKIQNHEYLGIAGSEAFIELAQTLTLGADIMKRLDKSIASIQTVSGTGANHMAACFLVKNLRPKRVFIPSPTWINHRSIWADLEVLIEDYPYYAPSTKGVDLERMLSVLENTAEARDIVIVQACAHNPTGVDLSRAQWAQVLEIVKKKSLYVVFDSAYQGFATGDVDGDAWAIRFFVEKLILNDQSDHPGLCIAQSFSKNFGLYGERVGALHLVVPQQVSAQGPRSRLVALARTEYSNPPRFGASIVETILADEKLRGDWQRDLNTMSSRIMSMRRELRERLQAKGLPGNWSFIESQIGMFSYTELNLEQVTRLREEFHVYLLPSGRMSICGLNTRNVEYVASAFGEVIG